MLIRDGSSDVCSSDLAVVRHPQVAVVPVQPVHRLLQRMAGAHAAGARVGMDQLLRALGRLVQRRELGPQKLEVAHRFLLQDFPATTLLRANMTRSAEHTSELQSLMRISYAVFCLKNNKNTISSNNESN